jgi:hypothetical protein
LYGRDSVFRHVSRLSISVTAVNGAVCEAPALLFSGEKIGGVMRGSAVAPPNELSVSPQSPVFASLYFIAEQ